MFVCLYVYDRCVVTIHMYLHKNHITFSIRVIPDISHILYSHYWRTKGLSLPLLISAIYWKRNIIILIYSENVWRRIKLGGIFEIRAIFDSGQFKLSPRIQSIPSENMTGTQTNITERQTLTKNHIYRTTEPVL